MGELSNTQAEEIAAKRVLDNVKRVCLSGQMVSLVRHGHYDDDRWFGARVKGSHGVYHGAGESIADALTAAIRDHDERAGQR